MISIAICTHERSDDVALCVSALAPQLAGQSDELIVVDSCSTPQHAAALKSLSELHGATLLRLETPGLSLARNAALGAARGDWVAFLDDDTIPAPNWLPSLHKVVDNAPAGLAGVGGQTEPLWPSELSSRHISKRWLFYLSCIQAPLRRSVRAGAKVCGANLAFRKDRLLSVGAFRTDLGRIGDRLIGGEESLVIRLLLRAGFEVIYEPSVAVKHRIHAERLSISWIGKRAYWEGVTEVAMVKATGEHFPPNLAVSKLAASALIFHGLFFATRNPDFLIRAKIAAGALTRRRALNLPT
jgi:GT2 family glycosyltransferase